MTCEGLAASHACVGDVAERLSCGDVTEMDFDGGQGDGFQSVEYGDGRVGVGGWIDDDAVKFAQCLLNPIDENALVVGLADIDGETEFRRGVLDESDERGVVLLAVDIRFADAKHVEIRAV